MKRREFIKSFSLGAASLALPGCGALFNQHPSKQPTAERRSDRRPDIVVILADDMGFSDLGCYGSEIVTPNLDRLAAGGLKFTQFYNTARCCPTRASLLTGLYPHQAGVGHMMSDQGLDGYRGDLNNRCVTIAEALGQAGYATYMSGKWHVTRQLGLWSGNDALRSTHNWPCQRGFDRFYGTVHGGGSYFDPVSLTRDNEPLDGVGEGFYYTDSISDQAARFIGDHSAAQPEAPFFCYVAYTAPHWPMHALPEDIARYKGRYDSGWDALRRERHARMVDLGLVDPAWPLTARDGKVAAWDDASYKHWHRAVMEVYAAMIDRLDQGVGRIVEALDRAGRLDNTLLLFLADNGGCAEGGTAFETSGYAGGLSRARKSYQGRSVEFGHYATVMPGPGDTYQEYGRPWANASNTPFRLYKHYVHEGGIATPLIAHWPERFGSPGGFGSPDALRHEPGHVIDIMATCLDSAGAAYPSEFKGRAITPIEGRSFLPVFQGARLDREAIYWEHEANRAVRKGKWKLVARGKKGPWQLYDLEADRTETRNLAESFPQRADDMAALWTRWAERCNVLPWPWG